MAKMVMSQAQAMHFMDVLAGVAITAMGKAAPSELTDTEIKEVENFARSKFVEIMRSFETPMCTWKIDFDDEDEDWEWPEFLQQQ